MPYFTHGFELDEFSDLRIRNFEGDHSPINSKAYRIFLGNGVHADIDTKTGIGKKTGK
jgi:hypothetical protein